MPRQIRSWLRDTGKLTLGYIGVGLCFAVAGPIGFLLQKAGWKGSISITLVLAVGFLASYFFWRWFQRVELAVAVPPISNALALALSDRVGSSLAEAFVEAKRQGHSGTQLAAGLAPTSLNNQNVWKPVFKPAPVGAAYAGFSRNSS